MIFRSTRLLLLQSCKLLTTIKPQVTHKVLPVQYPTCEILTYSTNKFIDSKFFDDDVHDPDEFDFLPDSSDDNVDKLCGNDAEKLARLKYLRLKISISRQKGEHVPSKMNEKQWIRLLACETKTQQDTYLNTLFEREKMKLRDKTLKQIENERHEKYRQAILKQGPLKITTSGPVIHQLRYNALFFRISNYTVDKLYNYKLLQASMFAPKIIIDCGFESYMSATQMYAVSRQILVMWSQNRNNISPFHFIFCNLCPEGQLLDHLTNLLPSIEDHGYPFFHTQQSYLDLFPREKLVYLSPHAYDTLEEFNGNDVYILGGVENRREGTPLTRTKAKMDGIRCMKFPMRENNVRLTTSQQILPLETVHAILCDLKDTNNWKFSLRHVSNKRISLNDDLSKMYSLDQAVKTHQRVQVTYDLLLEQTKEL